MHGRQLRPARPVFDQWPNSHRVIGRLAFCPDCRRQWFVCSGGSLAAGEGWLRVLVEELDLQQLDRAPTEPFVRSAAWYVEGVRQPDGGFDSREGVMRQGDPPSPRP